MTGCAVVARLGRVVAPTQTKAAAATKLANRLVKHVTVDGAQRHLIALQRIADRNGGNRASNTPGYAASVA